MTSAQLSTELGVRAILHTILSIFGVFVYAFYQPDGILWQNVFVSGGIHFFLNWKFQYTKFIGSAVDAMSNVSRSNREQNLAQVQPGDPTGNQTGNSRNTWAQEAWSAFCWNIFFRDTVSIEYEMVYGFKMIR